MPLTIGSATFDSRRPAIIVSLTSASLPALADEAAEAVAAGADVVEWRVDAYATHADPDALAEPAVELGRITGDIPVMATLRTTHEGGEAELTEGEYRDAVEALIGNGHVQLIDVEAARDRSSALIAAASDAGVSTVVSHHDFTTTPSFEVLRARLDGLADLEADLCKVAVMPHHPRDVLTLLEGAVDFTERHAPALIAIAMGPLGTMTRLHAGTFGSCATFATVGEASAPGQLPLAHTRATLDLLSNEW